MAETAIMRAIRAALGTAARHCRAFRNNRGHGWVGELVSYKDGVAILKKARPIEFGLVNGAGDLIGWTTKTITPDMAGQKIAVFTSWEVKTETGPTRDAQIVWRTNVVDAGGLAAIVRSPEEALRLAGAM